jgi:galactose mutarotase-like enzyme
VTLDADGMLPLTGNTFAADALVLADGQVHRVSMLDKNHAPYLTLLFAAPLVGLWSPTSGKAPFVCIEPWWGRCDDAGFNGDFSERKYVNTLAPGKTFEASYMVIFDNF